MAKQKFDLAAFIASTANGEIVHTDAKQFSNPKAYEKAIADGLIEVNSDMKDASGAVATRATTKGIESMQQNTNATPAPKADEFQIDDGATLTGIERNVLGGAEKYPFSKLQPGQSFFVPATEGNEDPAKSLASTVSSASKRYATDTGEKKTRGSKEVAVLSYERKFELRRRTAAQEEADGFAPRNGVRIYRTK